MEYNSNKLKEGMEVFYRYEKVKIKQIFIEQKEFRIEYHDYNIILPFSTNLILMPNEFVERVSEIVAEEHKKFEKKCVGENINPAIYKLFEEYWLGICNEILNSTRLLSFYDFVAKLNEATELANQISVKGVLLFKKD